MEASALLARETPAATWGWTDDTHMALSIVEMLLVWGRIDEDRLATLFAKRYLEEPWRGYALGAQRLLSSYAKGADWREAAPKLFNGGSYGNGGAMRAAPIGAYFCSVPERAAAEADRSAKVTHAHPEGRSGAIAAALGAAVACAPERPTGREYLNRVLRDLPDSRTKEGIARAAEIGSHELQRAISELGTGNQIAAFDTVPFCLWIAAHHGEDFESAMWTTVQGGGDMDTTCAIVGGILGPTTQLPEAWIGRVEPLPEGFHPHPPD